VRPAASTSTGEQATIGKGLFIKGEITGSESLYIDGKIEGTINLPGNRLTIGRNGQVNAAINAREIVVLGKVRGNVSATDRVDIRAEGSLTGDVAAARISIEDGAFFKGGIDIKKTAEGKGAQAAEIAKPVRHYLRACNRAEPRNHLRGCPVLFSGPRPRLHPESDLLSRSMG
jgi:cytoskeletal protein CcmA (bactofilin family)